jgi:malate dehydrogenase
MAVVSQGQYGIPKGLIFGFPCKTTGGGKFEVVEGLQHDDFGKSKLASTLQELEGEKAAVSELLS